jgi:hypothetical protein
MWYSAGNPRRAFTLETTRVATPAMVPPCCRSLNPHHHGTTTINRKENQGNKGRDTYFECSNEGHASPESQAKFADTITQQILERIALGLFG